MQPAGAFELMGVVTSGKPMQPLICQLACRGLVPSVVAILPEAAITYGLFDLLKRNITRWSGRTEAGVVPSLTAGALAAFMGQVVAYPFETVSRRMQVRFPLKILPGGFALTWRLRRLFFVCSFDDLNYGDGRLTAELNGISSCWCSA
jgi:hypothetical protein